MFGSFATRFLTSLLREDAKAKADVFLKLSLNGNVNHGGNCSLGIENAQLVAISAHNNKALAIRFSAHF